MVQNISAVRFSNMIFESLWNNKYIDNVQITLSETVGVEERGAYYDNNGALRYGAKSYPSDCCLLVMEPPLSLQGEDVRSKIKALRSLRLYNTPEEVNRNFIRAQYAESCKSFASYREEPNVNPASSTETFVAGKILVDNFRWKGVPFSHPNR